jgi:hypothetical protein
MAEKSTIMGAIEGISRRDDRQLEAEFKAAVDSVQ